MILQNRRVQPRDRIHRIDHARPRGDPHPFSVQVHADRAAIAWLLFVGVLNGEHPRDGLKKRLLRASVQVGNNPIVSHDQQLVVREKPREEMR